jgi:hypothetical protein
MRERAVLQENFLKSNNMSFDTDVPREESVKRKGDRPVEKLKLLKKTDLTAPE